MKDNDYICPDCKSELSVDTEKGLRCANNHYFRFIEGTSVPVFEQAEENINEYTTAEAAEIHDNSLKWLFATFGGNEETLRAKLISRLHLKEGQRVLITGVGAGNDLPYFAKILGAEGIIFAQDFSSQMLKSAVERSRDLYGLDGYNLEFSVSDAANLPFHDSFFDAVYHFGGLNLFSDIRIGIAEMDRVVKSGGRVVFGDEGLPSWLRNTEYGKMIINNNPLCNFEAPLAFLPPTVRGVNLSWEVGYCFYVIDYTASDIPLPINIDVPHVGRRGGTIRSRYFGNVEGIDPALKERLYAEAEKRGVGRVAFLESLLRKGLKT